MEEIFVLKRQKEQNDHYKSNHLTSHMRLERTVVFTKHEAKDNK
jgi:hypothetical protein